MDQERNLIEFLDRPAFRVEDGFIKSVNKAAATLCIAEGQPIDDILGESAEAYAAYQEGALFITLNIADIPTPAAVFRLGTQDIFLPEAALSDQGAQTLALAAQHLRIQLNSVMATAQTQYTDTSGQLNRGLHRLQRMVCNMADLSRYRSATPAMELMDVCSVFYEIIEKANALLQSETVSIQYTAPKGPIYSMINYEMLERAVYNLLSNAVKFSGEKVCLKIKLTKSKNAVVFTIEDNGSGIDTSLYASIYNRYLRQPTIEDGLHGIGIGIALVQTVASAHGGTVLISSSENCGTKITFSLALRQRDSVTVHNTILRPYDYSGGYDHGLLELSEVISPHHYITK